MAKVYFTNPEAVQQEIASVRWPLSCPFCKEQEVRAKRRDSEFSSDFVLFCQNCHASSEWRSPIEWQGIIKERKTMDQPEED